MLKTPFPELPVAFEPLRGLRKRSDLEATGPALRIPAPRNEPGLFKHLEVFGDAGLAHRERFRKFCHRGIPGSEPCEDRPPRRIGERCKCCIKVVGRHYITPRFKNQTVMLGRVVMIVNG